MQDKILHEPTYNDYTGNVGVPHGGGFLVHPCPGPLTPLAQGDNSYVLRLTFVYAGGAHLATPSPLRLS